jgi:hypothetical protein
MVVIPETTKERTDSNNGEVMIVPKQVTKLNGCRLKFGEGLSISKAQNPLFP